MQKSQSRSGIFSFVLLLIFCFIFISSNGLAEIYKYKNKEGVWVFTDNPQELPDQGVNVVSGDETQTSDSGPGFDINAFLTEKLKPVNRIEQAALGVVTVKTPIGTGTGFFVTDTGFIVTNKHVLRITEDQSERMEANRDLIEDEIEKYETQFEIEQEKLELFKQNLDQYETRINALKNERQKSLARKNYEIELKRYQAWKEDFSSRKDQFEAGITTYRDQQREADYNETLSSIKTSFTITLADNTQRTADLVKVSETYDLALLKLEKHKTPYLAPARQENVFQGQQVYAIGNPINLKNSVSGGIMSGREDIFIKTDAKIYPGNSGGPLITPGGEVIGVNTFKKLTHKFEGLGFAISIDIVLEEFGSYFLK